MIDNNLNFYKICFDNSREGILVTDLLGKIILVNKRVESIFGYKEHELVNENVNLLLPKSIRNKLKLANNHNISYQEINIDQRNLYGIHKDGHKVPVIIGLNTFELNGQTYVKAFISDITNYKKKEQLFRKLNVNLEQEVKTKNEELKVINKQLKEANKILIIEIQNKIIAEKKVKSALEKEKELTNMKSNFLTLASHEFRTPLSGIMTSATLIDKYAQNNSVEKIEKHVDQIKAMVHHLNRILYDFLTLEQLNNNEFKLNNTNLNPFELINSIIVDIKSLLKKEQKIKYIVFNSNKEISCDKKILIAVITNLLYNAIKYSHDNSLIELSSKIRNKKLIISIKDNGIGIPKNDQKHIFERFFRARNALEIQGTGVGLNIIKGYVDNMGGSIKFKSIENIGTTFTVNLPITSTIKIEHYEKEGVTY